MYYETGAGPAYAVAQKGLAAMAPKGDTLTATPLGSLTAGNAMKKLWSEILGLGVYHDRSYGKRKKRVTKLRHARQWM